MFCPGEFNIADLHSRGCSGAALIKNDEWFHGPKFLELSEENWPKPPRCNGAEREIALSETVKSVNKSTTQSLTVLEKKHNTDNVGKVVDCHRYSSKTRLLRVTRTYIHRFVRRIKGLTVSKTLELSAEELIEAEQMWIKDIQNNAFPEEVKQLINGTKTSSSRLDQLRLFLDDKEI